MPLNRLKPDFRKLTSKLPMRRKATGFVRRHPRFEVRFASAILIEDRTVPLPGIVNEISQGGVRFRPATTYLLERRDDHASVMVGDVYYPCKIMSTSPDGYGIKLTRLLDPDLVDQMVAEFGPEHLSRIRKVA